MLQAGIPIIKSIESFERSRSFSRSFRDGIRRVRFELEQGRPLSESRAATKIFPDLYLNLMSAGERSGKLHKICKKISENIQREMTFRKRIFGAMIYPVVLLHLGILLPPLYLIFSEGTAAYFGNVFQIFIWLYGVLILLYFLKVAVSVFDPLSIMFDHLVTFVPVVGALIKKMAIYRFYLSLYFLYDAGNSVTKAFESSFSLITQRSLKSNMTPVLRKIQQNMTLDDSLKAQSFLPITDTNLIVTGEITGTLDEKLKQILEIYEEDIEMRLKLLEKFLPFIVYLFVALFVAWKVISFWIGYYEKLTQFF